MNRVRSVPRETTSFLPERQAAQETARHHPLFTLPPPPAPGVLALILYWRRNLSTNFSCRRLFCLKKLTHREDLLDIEDDNEPVIPPCHAPDELRIEPSADPGRGARSRPVPARRPPARSRQGHRGRSSPSSISTSATMMQVLTVFSTGGRPNLTFISITGTTLPLEIDHSLHEFRGLRHLRHPREFKESPARGLHRGQKHSSFRLKVRYCVVSMIRNLSNSLSVAILAVPQVEAPLPLPETCCYALSSAPGRHLSPLPSVPLFSPPAPPP